MNIIVALFFTAFAARRMLTYLHIFQQEEYDGPRFLHWLGETKAFDRRVSLGLLAAAGLTAIISAGWAQFVAAIAACGVFAAGFAIEKDPRKSAKKKLAMTKRAQRIFAVAMAVILTGAVLAVFYFPWLWVWIVLVQAIPLCLPFAVIATDPFEKRIQQRFWNEAHEKLLRLEPKVVAITGSYGKTTVKHILNHVLSANAQTLATPGSVNTPMGIARIVREQLAPHHQFFLCEMGAYGPGSIARLCRLAPPDLGIITAIGPAHYERFKTLDAVAQTKYELAEAVIKKNGKTIVNSQTLEFDYSRQMADANKSAFVVVGEQSGNGLRVIDHNQDRDGIHVDIEWRGSPYTIDAPLYGEHQAINLALVFAAAATVGLRPDQILRALKSAPQTAHRLEVKRPEGGSIIIDDAYNSNPTGFASGLRVLNTLCDDDGKRVVVTPGMVELGAAHDEEHARIGALAGEKADILVAIRPERIKPLVEAFRAKKGDENIIECASFTEASAWTAQHTGPGDVILIENDLPDLYETRLKL